MLTEQLTKETFAALENANPGAILDIIENDIVAPGVSFIVKRPGDGDWKRYRSMQANDEQAPAANRTLVFGLLVDPTPAEFTSMLKEKPGLTDTLAFKIRELAGVSTASTVRKL